MKPDFEKAQNAATNLLLQQNIDSLFIDVRNFTLPDSIHIDTMQNFCKLTNYPISSLDNGAIDGACLLRKGPHRIILYDEGIPNEQRKHWGIAHELGHAVLGHVDDNKEAEIEAHFFAAQLIAPEIVLLEICKRQGRLSDHDLFSHFNLSYEAAAKRIQTLRHRYCYNYGAMDKQLLEKFSPILDRETSIGRWVS